MGYVFEYPVDARIVARATSAAYGASAAEEQLRYAEQQSRADDQLEFQYEQQAIDAVQRQQALDDNNYQFNAQLGQQAIQQYQANQLGWAGVQQNYAQLDQGYAQLDAQQQNAELNFAGQQVRAQAGLSAKEMQIVAAQAEARRRENFDRAMTLDKRIEEEAQKGWFKSQAQYDQAKADVFRQTGIESGALQREYMNQEVTMHREARQKAVNGFAAETGMSPEEIDHHLIDDGNGRYVLDDPDFVSKMASDKANNKRMIAIKEMDLAATAETTRSTAAAQYKKDAAVADAAAAATYRKLLAEEAKRRSTKGDMMQSPPVPPKTVHPDDLPDDVKQKLSEQALLEHPTPPLPPGM